MNKVHLNDLIDELRISEKLKNKFKNLNFMYHNNYADGDLKQPYGWKVSDAYKNLSKENRWQIAPRGTFLPILFGPFAYFFKGLFIKGLFFCAVMFFLILVIPESQGVLLKFIGLLFAVYLSKMLELDIFYEKCLKNKHIYEMISSGCVDFYPNDSYPPIPINKKMSLKQALLLSLCIILVPLIIVALIYMSMPKFG